MIDENEYGSKLEKNKTENQLVITGYESKIKSMELLISELHDNLNLKNYN
jgi:hypothetical protein